VTKTAVHSTSRAMRMVQTVPADRTCFMTVQEAHSWCDFNVIAVYLNCFASVTAGVKLHCP
jgi:hypothetical protein